MGTVDEQAWGRQGPRGRAAAETVIRALLLVCKYFLWPCWEPAGPALGGDSSHSHSAEGGMEGLVLCSPHPKSLLARAPGLGWREDGLAQSQKATPAQPLMSPDPTSWSVPYPTPISAPQKLPDSNLTSTKNTFTQE